MIVMSIRDDRGRPVLCGAASGRRTELDDHGWVPRRDSSLGVRVPVGVLKGGEGGTARAAPAVLVRCLEDGLLMPGVGP
jgi:hypothetical protein